MMMVLRVVEEVTGTSMFWYFLTQAAVSERAASSSRRDGIPNLNSCAGCRVLGAGKRLRVTATSVPTGVRHPALSADAALDNVVGDCEMISQNQRITAASTENDCDVNDCDVRLKEKEAQWIID